VARPAAPWSRSPERAALLALYAEADALVAGWACRCSSGVEAPDCCHFAVTGREPYPTAVELEEVRHGLRAAGAPPPDRRRLPTVASRPCPLLSREGRCTVYAHRPLGCRTFFCPDAEGPGGSRRWPRARLLDLGRRIADLSARFAPRDPRPRSLAAALLGVVPRPGAAR